MTEEAREKKLNEVFNGVGYAQLKPVPKATFLTEQQKQKCVFNKAPEADIWSAQDPSPQNDCWHNQAWIALYFDLLVAWLHDIKGNNLLNQSEPIYLLCLGEARYAIGLALMNKLLEEGPQQGLEEFNVCLLLMETDKTAQAQLLCHPDFSHYHQIGKAHILDWSIFSEQPLPHQDIDETMLAFGANPAFMIAHGVLSKLPQAIYHTHYQDLYRAEIATTANIGPSNSAASTEAANNQELPLLWRMKAHSPSDKAEDKIRLAYQWCKTSIDLEVGHGDLALPFDDILRKELASGGCKPIALPINAVQVCMRLEQAFGKGVCHLISDHLTPELGLNLPTVITQTGVELPLDLKALSYVSSAVTHTQIKKHEGTEMATCMRLSHQNPEEFIYTQHIFEKVCSEHLPSCQVNIYESLKSCTQSLTEAQMLAYVRLCQYDPNMLQIFLPQLLKQGVSVENRIQWCGVLSQVWQNHIVDCRQESFAFALGLLAIDLSHWGLAKNCMLACMEVNGPSTAYLHNLALVAWATGEQEVASQSAELALDFSPEDAQVKQLNIDIATYQQQTNQLSWFDKGLRCTRCDVSGLRILPLGAHQLGEFYIQYRQDDIAERLRGLKIDQFNQLQAAWPTWLEEGLRGEKAHFALVHESFGFVGAIVVDFYPLPDAIDNQNSQRHAHLSFWVGCDYQHRGFGKIGVSLAVATLKQRSLKLNISHIKTSAWVHNTASRHILTQVGFNALEEVIGEGAEQEVFYQLALVN